MSYLNNGGGGLLLRRRMMMQKAGPIEPLPDILTEVRKRTATEDLLGGDILSVVQNMVEPTQGAGMPNLTAYVTFENNNATNYKARSMLYVKGGPIFFVRGTDTTPRIETAGFSSSWSFAYTAGTVITAYIFNDI